jgi:hypothetical protein
MNMHLKIFNKNGGIVSDIRTSKKRRILHNIQADTTSNALFFINVSYGNGFANSGEYRSKQDFLLALDTFTEK